MILDFFGIQLQRISQDDIEMLRIWRNDSKIVSHMFFTEYITPEMQMQWFHSLKVCDFYFLIMYKNQAIGLINLSQENLEEKSAYAGLFIYEEKYLGSPIPILASVLLLKFAFEERNLQVVKAKVQNQNLHAISYNQELGFQRVSDFEWQLNIANYHQKTVPLIIKLNKLFA